MENRDASGIGEPHRSKTVEDVKTSANRIGETAAESGREQLGAATGRVRALFEQQTHRAADQLTGVAHALHSAADQLKDENNGTAARYAGQAAERVEEVADLIRNSTVDDVVDRVETFARRQPEMFLGAAFAAGFLFARFIKSSGERRHRSGIYESSSYGGSARYGTPDRYRSDVAGAYPPAGTGREYERDGYRSSTGGATGSGMYGTTGPRSGGTTSGGSAGAVSRNSATDLGMTGDMRGSAGAASGRVGGVPGTSGTASTAATGAGTSRMGATGMGMTGATPAATGSTGAGSSGMGMGGTTTRLSQTSTAASMPKPKETLR